MIALVLDAGALIAVDRGDRDMRDLILDVVDATVAPLAKGADELYTSDPRDLRKLCEATGFKAVVISC